MSINRVMTEDIRINGERLWARLMQMAQIGATTNGGVCRLALTDLDRRGRDLFCQWARDAGCAIQVDAIGNIFARRAGVDESAGAIAAGSHLDTQPSGGKFDGALGVLASLEVIDTLNDQGVRTHAPIESVVWTNEEGARFGPAMLGSGVYAGAFDLAFAYERRDQDDLALGDELARIGYVGPLEPGANELAAHFELHIEQGPVLESNANDVGVVTGVNGIMWYDVEVQGFETHAGPTPMAMRRDPVPVAAQVIPDIYAAARHVGESSMVYAKVSNGFKSRRVHRRRRTTRSIRARLNLDWKDLQLNNSLQPLRANSREKRDRADRRPSGRPKSDCPPGRLRKC